MSIDLNAFFGLLVGLTTIAAYVHVTFKQSAEVTRPRNWLTGLRWLLLATLVIAVLGYVPSLVLLGLRTFHIESPVLRSISTITGQVSRLGGAVLIEAVYNYKRKED
jgi:hypothetical protein